MTFNSEAVKGINQRVRLNLVGQDSNAFFLLGAFRRAARKQGWPLAAIDAVSEECQSGDYDHLLQTLIWFTELGTEADE